MAAPPMLEFQLDHAGLARAVGRILEDRTSGVEEGAGGGTWSLWSRAWRWACRRGLGPKRWEQIQRRSDLRKCLRTLRRKTDALRKPVLVYLVPFDIWKLRTGGGKRIAGLAKALSAEFGVFVVMPLPAVQKMAIKDIAPDCHMIGIPQSREYDDRCRALDGDPGAGLFAFADHFDVLPEFHVVLGWLGNRARAWMFESPVAWPVLRRFRSSGCPVIYDAPNDYSQFLQKAYACEDMGLVNRLVDMEREVLGQATLATFCTADDLEAARARYPSCTIPMMQIPNGVDVGACRPTFPSQAADCRRKAGLDRPVAVFAGAHHNPNYVAVDRIARELAPAFPNVVFAVVGMHLAAYRKHGGSEPARNAVFTGPVPEEIKEALFSLSDLGLAPMSGGTGSSLKIPDYVAHGKVVVGTPVGLRGFEELAAIPSVIATEDVLGQVGRVVGALAKDPAAYDDSCRAAWAFVKGTLDWSVAARPLLEELARLVSAANR